jgi:hypothetical protein
MNTSHKHGLLFYGAIVSAVHFTATVLLLSLPMLMLRPEAMVGSGDVKPYWPPSRLRDAVQGTGDILSLPARWVSDSWAGMPDLIEVVLFVANSCLWGFALSLLLRLVLTHQHPNEPKLA